MKKFDIKEYFSEEKSISLFCRFSKAALSQKRLRFSVLEDIFGFLYDKSRYFRLKIIPGGENRMLSMLYYLGPEARG